MARVMTANSSGLGVAVEGSGDEEAQSPEHGVNAEADPNYVALSLTEDGRPVLKQVSRDMKIVLGRCVYARPSACLRACLRLA